MITYRIFVLLVTQFEKVLIKIILDLEIYLIKLRRKSSLKSTTISQVIFYKIIKSNIYM